jgi:hypothetical protein
MLCTDPSTLLSLTIGEPAAHRGITLVPLFPRRDPVAVYVTLGEALALGASVGEVDDAGLVSELVLRNPTPHRVLLYDGEELLGAKQNRIVDVAVLADAKSELTIPVSCVEQGRWSPPVTSFHDAPAAPGPEVRRVKAERLAAAPGRRGAAQSAVWAAVRRKEAELGAASPTAAHADLFSARGEDVERLMGAFRLTPGQCGMAMARGGRVVCLDFVSRPEAFARFFPKLLAGYALDAIGRLDGPDTPAEAFEAFVDALSERPPVLRRSVGLGDDLRLSGPGLVGSGLVLSGELIQLSAYGGDEGPRGSVAPPSARARSLMR